MNANFVEPGETCEGEIGHIIVGGGAPIGEGDGVKENQMFLQDMLIITNTTLVNTHFQKHQSMK